MRKKASSLVALLWALYQLAIIVWPSGLLLTQQRAIHLGFGLVLLWINKPLRFKKKTVPAAYQTIETFVLGLVSAAITVYMCIHAERFEFYAFGYTTADKIVAIVGILIILEATRRVLGPALVVIAGVFIAYGLWGNFIPGNFGHRGNSLTNLATKLFMTADGVFGSILGTSASLIFIYLIFGGFLNVMGGGKFFTDIAFAGFGSKRGGPAKMAVVSSCLFGSISGSTIANVVTTGTITIPLMKNIGYRPAFAAAVEAAASTGGQYMPPIMGATAFIMAQMMGVTYTEVVKAAFVSAILYYLALLVMVDFEAAKNGMKGLPRESLPNLKAVVKEGWHFLVPFAVMLYFLLYLRYEAQFAALYAIIAMIIMVFIRRPGKAVVKETVDSLIEGAQSAITVAIPCACIGVVVGVILITGIGLEFSSLMRSLSGGYLFPLLMIMMITSLILGLGVPTTAAYILVTVVAVPPMIELGVSPMAANLFCLYFAVISSITPPVALAAFTAANIAKCDPFKTGWIAVRLGISGFIIPYVFVYQPGLLLEGTILEIVIAVVSCSLGVISLSAALQRYLTHNLNLAETILFYAIAVCLITPNFALDIVGYILFALYMVKCLVDKKKALVKEA